jgi:Excinuclease ATPase subunit
VVFQGPYDEILEDEDSLTGQYLSGRKEVPVPDERRPVDPDDTLVVENARQHNLKHVDVEIPLGQIVCVTGVSGSGKSTLTNQTLFEGLHRLKGGSGDGKVGAHDTIRGHDNVDAVEMVDQSSIGRSPRSNPATYTNAFDGIRKLFAQARQSQVHGYDRGTFSFNTKGGRCEECEGQGVVKVEMQFLADLYLECEACNGQRYKKEVLNVTYNGKNIADVLDMTVDEAADFFEGERAITNKLEDAAGHWARLPHARPALDDAERRGGPAHQAGEPPKRADVGPHPLHLRRAHDRLALRRHQAAPDCL